MLDDIAGMGDHARTDHLAVGEFYALEQMVLVLVARICGFKTVRAGVDLEHVVDDVGERSRSGSKKISGRNGSSICTRIPASAMARYSLPSSPPSAWKYSSSDL